MRRWRMAMLSILAVFGVAACLFRPSQPKLVWYTSPTFPEYTGAKRLKTLVPGGWKEGAVLLATGGSPTARHTQFFDVDGESGTRLSWLPSWIRGFFVHEQNNSLSVTPIGRLKSSGEIQLDRFRNGQSFRATRIVVADGENYQVSFSSSNRAEFEATYRRICQSFQVIPVK